MIDSRTIQIDLKARIVVIKMKKLFHVIVIATLALSSAGCSVVYKATSDTLISFTEDEAVPYMLAARDIELSCSMAQSFTPLFLSFSRVTDSPDRLAVLLYLMSGSCVEFKAWEEELRYLRAMHEKRPVEARDARVAQQRYIALAAQRQLQGYQYFIREFGEPGGECPAFSSENDEFFWLVGLVNGILAIMNDVAVGGQAEVPLSIAGKVGRAAGCIDNAQWWGAPDAIKAAIGVILPENSAQDRPALQMLDAAVETGVKEGIFLAHVLAAQVYLGQGDSVRVKNIIRDYVGIDKKHQGHPEYQILNEVARMQIRAISDKMWTEATGQRTPLNKMGTFWDDKVEDVETIDIDEIL